MNKQEKNIAYQKEYYLKNKEKHLAYMAQKCECVFCGRTVNKTNMTKHINSKLCEKRRVAIAAVILWQRDNNLNDDDSDSDDD